MQHRTEELRQSGLDFVSDIGEAFFEELRASAGDDPAAAARFEVLAKAMMDKFTQCGEQQLARRLNAIEVARTQTVSDIESGTVEEELEADLEKQ